MIIKIGGGKTCFEYIDFILEDLVTIKSRKVLVHGANYEADMLSEKLGKPVNTILSPSGHVSRRTDKETLDILKMAYCLVNKRIVEKLQKLGYNAVGLTGLDGRIWEGKRKPYIKTVVGNKIKMVRDDYTGKIEKVNGELLNMLLDANYLPVLTIPGISYEHESINVDNDRALAMMVKPLKCETIVMLFEAPGLLKNKNDEKSIIKTIDKNELDIMITNTEGRMKKKMLGIKEAFQQGVKKGDFRLQNPIKKALLGDGTVIS